MGIYLILEEKWGCRRYFLDVANPKHQNQKPQVRFHKNRLAAQLRVRKSAAQKEISRNTGLVESVKHRQAVVMKALNEPEIGRLQRKKAEKVELHRGSGGGEDGMDVDL